MMTQWSDADVMAAEEHMHELVEEAHREQMLREAHVVGNPPRWWTWLRKQIVRQTANRNKDHHDTTA